MDAYPHAVQCAYMSYTMPQQSSTWRNRGVFRPVLGRTSHCITAEARIVRIHPADIEHEPADLDWTALCRNVVQEQPPSHVSAT